MRNCPKCNKPTEKNFCGFCGAKITEVCPKCWKKEGQPNSCPGEKCTDELTQCPECGATFIPEANSCPCCGEKQVAEPKNMSAQSDKNVASLEQIASQYALTSLITTIDVSFLEKQLETMFEAVKKVKELNKTAREKL